MPQHIYIRMSGFGLSLVPFSPFRAGQGEAGPASVDIVHFAAKGEQFARIVADGTGGFTSKIDSNTRSVYDVVEITTGPTPPKWILETSVFTCDWPENYEVASTSYPQEATILDLFSADQQHIYIQPCRQRPLLRQMCVQGQQIISLDEAGGSIELQYRHQNLPWYQRHRIVSFGGHEGRSLVVSCQAPVPLAASVRADAESVARSILPLDTRSD